MLAKPNNWKAAVLRARAGRLRRLAVSADIPAVGQGMRRLAELLERLARRFEQR